MKRKVAQAMLIFSLALGTIGMSANAYTLNPLYSPSGNSIVPPDDDIPGVRPEDEIPPNDIPPEEIPPDEIPPTDIPPREIPPSDVPPGSPKTGDINILLIEGIGLISLGAAAVTAGSRKKRYA